MQKIVIKVLIAAGLFLTTFSLLSYYFFYFLPRQQQANRSQQEACHPISQDQAIAIVSKQVEVKNFLNTMKKSNQPVAFMATNKGKDWDVQVAEDHPDHLATFNLYTLDVCTGKLKCSLEIYNPKGELIRASNENEYPCN